MYIALIGDIISSKNIKDRAEAQVKLLNLMKIINKKYKEYLVSPFTVTTGDFKLYFYLINIYFR